MEGDFFALLPLLPHEVDTVLALAVLEHFPRPEEFFRAALCLLKTGGRLYVSTPSPRARVWHTFGVRLGLLSSCAHQEHQPLLPMERVRAMAEEAGFLTLREERFLLGLNQLHIFMKAHTPGVSPRGRP